MVLTYCSTQAETCRCGRGFEVYWYFTGQTSRATSSQSRGRGHLERQRMGRTTPETGYEYIYTIVSAAVVCSQLPRRYYGGYGFLDMTNYLHVFALRGVGDGWDRLGQDGMCTISGNTLYKTRHTGYFLIPPNSCTSWHLALHLLVCGYFLLLIHYSSSHWQPYSPLLHPHSPPASSQPSPPPSHPSAPPSAYPNHS